MPRSDRTEQDPWASLQPLLDQELARLPGKYREVIVLSDLEGRTRREVARQLKIPEGTVSSRLATARKLLAKRMARHGLPVAGTVTMLTENAAAVPCSLISRTVQTACLLATGQAVVSTQVAALMDGVLKAMLMTRLKTVTAVCLAILMCSGAGVLTHDAVGQPSPQATEGRPSLAASTKDIDALQGVWRVVGSTAGDPKTQHAVFMVQGNRACWEFSSEPYRCEGGLYLDPSSDPPAFDFATGTSTFNPDYS